MIVHNNNIKLCLVLHCVVDNIETQNKGVFTLNLYGAVQMSTSVFAYLCQFIWAIVKAVNGTLLTWTEQPNQDCLKRVSRTTSKLTVVWFVVLKARETNHWNK